MINMNRVIEVGRLTADAELRYLKDGTAVANFTLAVNRNYDKDKTDFIDCVAWRKTAEFAGEWLRKGNITTVDGKLQTRTYEDSDGNTRKVTEVRCDNIQSIEWPGDNEQTEKPQQNTESAEDSDIEVPF